MDNYINHRNGASARLLPSLLANIKIDLNVANNNLANDNLASKRQITWDQWNSLYTSIKTYYGARGNGASDLDWEIHWEWDVGRVKRDEVDNVVKKRQACSRPVSLSVGSDSSGTGEGSTTAGTGITTSEKTTTTATSVIITTSREDSTTAASTSISTPGKASTTSFVSDSTIDLPSTSSENPNRVKSDSTAPSSTPYSFSCVTKPSVSPFF